jgi:hypothetical protein
VCSASVCVRLKVVGVTRGVYLCNVSLLIGACVTLPVMAVSKRVVVSSVFCSSILVNVTIYINNYRNSFYT